MVLHTWRPAAVIGSGAKHIMPNNYRVKVSPDGESYIMQFPDIPEAITRGDTLGHATAQPSTKTIKKERDPSLSQVGKPWTREEAERLLTAFDGGTSIDELARFHGRTKGGITSRLLK